MLADRQSLADEISRLEKELDSQHFRGLFDKRAQHQKEKRLKKLRRELAEQDGTVVTQMPFRKTESDEKPLPARQPKTVKAPPPANKPAPASRAAKTPAKPAARPAAKPKAPAAKKKSPAKSKPASRPRKKSK